MHGARDVGVVLAVVLGEHVEHLLRLLRRVGAVEVDQRTVVGEPTRQDREVGPHLVDVVRRRGVEGPGGRGRAHSEAAALTYLS
jgi:hypothetical protein